MNTIKQILLYYPEIYLVILGISLMMMNLFLMGTIFNGLAIIIVLIRIIFGVKNLVKKKKK